MRILTFVGRHGRALKLGSIVAAFVLVAGGVTLGMNSAAGSPAPERPSGSAQPQTIVNPNRHYVVGTVAEALTPGRAIVRMKNGRFVVVEYDKQTVVRRDRQAAGVGALRRGTRVIILGSPRDGHLHADIVTITGAAPARPAVAPVRATPTAAATPKP